MTSKAPSYLSLAAKKPVFSASMLFSLLCLIVFIGNVRVYRFLQIDDAFITYRFAWRLVQDGTLRWNLMEGPVEGYTSFLSVLISAVFLFLRFDPLTSWKVLGVMLSLGGAMAAICGAWFFCRRWWPEGISLGVPFWLGGLYLANPILALHAMSGMETILFMFWMTVLTVFAFHIAWEEPRGRGAMRLFSVGLLMLGMIRPEGVLWAGFLLLGVLIALPPADRRRFALSVLLFLILPGMIYFVARWIYFGEMLPATFHAKAGSAVRPGLGRLNTYLPSHHEVWRYVRQYWRGFYLLGLFLAMAGLFRSANRRASAMASAPVLFGAIGSTLCLAFFASVHLLMGYSHRFFFPFGQTLWLLLVLPTTALIFRAFSQRFRGIALTFGLLVFAFSMAVHARYAVGHARNAPSILESNHRWQDGYTRVGRALDEVALRTGSQMTLFHHNMGELMYAAPRWDSIDPVGLVDRHVSRHGFSPDHVFARNPELFILPSRSRQTITPYEAEVFPDISHVLYGDPRMREFRYLGFFPDLRFWSEGRMHFLFRSDLLIREPWIEPFLTERLDLQKDPLFGPEPGFSYTAEGDIP